MTSASKVRTGTICVLTFAHKKGKVTVLDQMKQFIILALLMMLPVVAWAQAGTGPGDQPGPLTGPNPVVIPEVTDPGSIANLFQAASNTWAGKALTYVPSLFAALALLELAWFGIERYLHRNDIHSVFYAMSGKLMALAFFYTVTIKAGEWFPQIIESFTVLGKTASGVDGIGPSAVLKTGINTAGQLVWSATQSAMDLDLLTAICLAFAALGILIGFLIITCQFVIALIDTYLCVGIGLFFTAFGGSRWTIPYLERFIAYCMGAGIKLMAMYFLVGTGLSFSRQWEALAAKTGPSVGAIETAWLIAGGAFLFAMICWYGSKWISGLLGGAPSLSLFDATAFAAPIVGTAAAGLGISASVLSGGTAAPAAAAVGAGGVSAAALAASTGGQTGGNPLGGGGGAPTATHPTSAAMAAAAAAARQASMSANAAASLLRSLPHGGGPPTAPHMPVGHKDV
jgi:type IV secretion system protein TrbL